MIKKISFSSIFFLILLPGIAQTKIEASAIRSKMQWFADAKLGIFIHAGIYSVKGVDESWSFHNNKISYDRLYAAAERFYFIKI